MASASRPDTSELLTRAAGGDRAATGELLVRHQARLRRMVEVRMDSRLAARFDPSDVLQETLVEAARRLSGYLRQRPLPFYPWLRQIAWEQLQKQQARHLKAAKRSAARELRPHEMLSERSVGQLARRLVTSATSPSRNLLRKELREQVRRALGLLSETDREVLVMRFLEQLSPAEIATVLHLREGTVKVRQVRALARLRTLLERELGDDLP